MAPDDLSREMKAEAHRLGFGIVGICAARPSDHRDHLLDWLARGMHAGMDYMSRDPEMRLDPSSIMQGARSCVAAGMNYYTPAPDDADDPTIARFARYALNEDYHDVLKKRLHTLGAHLQACADDPVRWRAVVDTAPVLEREVAARAGLGFIGKSTMLISPEIGTYFVIGVLFTDAELAPDHPVSGTCGRCTRCLDACPTGAIVAPRVVDARLCLSYHTIESKDPIPDSIAAKMGNRVFGCDVCQDVCPFNGGRARTTVHPEFVARAAVLGRRLSDDVGRCRTSSDLSDERSLSALFNLADDDFHEQFARSAVKRAGAAGLRRGAQSCTAAAQRRGTQGTQGT